MTSPTAGPPPPGVPFLAALEHAAADALARASSPAAAGSALRAVLASAYPIRPAGLAMGDVLAAAQALLRAAGGDEEAAPLSPHTTAYYRKCGVVSGPTSGRTAHARYDVRHVLELVVARLGVALGVAPLEETARWRQGLGRDPAPGTAADEALLARAAERLYAAVRRRTARPAVPPVLVVAPSAPVRAGRPDSAPPAGYPAPPVAPASAPECVPEPAPGTSMTAVWLPDRCVLLLPAGHPAGTDPARRAALVERLTGWLAAPPAAR